MTLRVVEMTGTVRMQGKSTAFYTPGRDGAHLAPLALADNLADTKNRAGQVVIGESVNGLPH